MRDSGAPDAFWPFAAAHACDVLNHTSRPDGSALSTFELATGNVPKIMDILPFGCKTYALIPSPRVGKMNPAKPRSWSGINLGRRLDITKALRVWVPTDSSIITSSNAYYNSSIFPWQPPDRRRIPEILAHAPVLHEPLSAPPPPTPRLDSLPARRSRTFLLIHSGEDSRPLGISTHLERSATRSSSSTTTPPRRPSAPTSATRTSTSPS